MEDHKLVWILGLVLFVSLSINGFYVINDFDQEIPFDTIHRHAIKSGVNYTTFGYSCHEDNTISADELKRCYINYYFSNEIKIQADILEDVICTREDCRLFARYEKFSGGKK